MKKERYYYSPEVNIGLAEVIMMGDSITHAKVVKPYHAKLPRVTICGIYHEDTNTITFGVSRCSPRDNFSKKEGKRISYGRANSIPYKTVEVPQGEKVYTCFIDISREIEKEVLEMNYPVKLH